MGPKTHFKHIIFSYIFFWDAGTVWGELAAEDHVRVCGTVNSDPGQRCGTVNFDPGVVLNNYMEVRTLWGNTLPRTM